MSRPLLNLLLGLMWIVLLVGGAFRPQADRGDRAPRPYVGYQAPSITARDFAGSPVRLEDYRGKALFINFWASWCGPCQSEMPEIQRLSAEIPPDAAILTVNMTSQERSLEEVKAYLESEGFTFPVATDLDGMTEQSYRVLSLPSSVFVSPEGTVVARVNGPMTASVMADYLRAAGR